MGTYPVLPMDYEKDIFESCNKVSNSNQIKKIKF